MALVLPEVQELIRKTWIWNSPEQEQKAQEEVLVQIHFMITSSGAAEGAVAEATAEKVETVPLVTVM